MSSISTSGLAGAISARRRTGISHGAGFWAIALTFLLVMASGALPTPLYIIYQGRDHLSGLIVTVIFAAYAAGVAMSLFLFGHVSDWVGRRRVLLPAVLLAVLSNLIFILWPELPGLLLGRVVAGLSVGPVTATATAYLADLHRARGLRSAGSRRAELVATAVNLGGIGVGPLLAGLLAQYAPDPLVVPFVVMGALVLGASGLLLLAPETAGLRERPRYRPQRVAVPPAGRSRFLAAAGAGMVAFAIFGVFTSLAPSFLADTLGYGSHALAGLVAFAAFASGAVGQMLLARLGARPLAATGIALLPVGLALLGAGAWMPSLAAFLLGGVLCGAAAGVLTKGGINTIIELAPPQARAESLAGFFLAAYIGLSVPIVGLGVATQYLSMKVGLIGFSAILVLALAAVARPLLRSPHRGHRSEAERDGAHGDSAFAVGPVRRGVAHELTPSSR